MEPQSQSTRVEEDSAGVSIQSLSFRRLYPQDAPDVKRVCNQLFPIE